MDKVVYIASGCAFVWLVLLQLAFTGFGIYERNVSEPTLMTHINSGLMLSLLFFSLGILYVSLKQKA